MTAPVELSIGGLAIIQFLAQTIGENVLGGEAHHFVRKSIEKWCDSPIDEATHLPKNHDLEQASRDALRAATFVLTLHLASSLEPEKPWIPKIVEHLKRNELFKVPLFANQSTPECQWTEPPHARTCEDHWRLS